MRTINIASMLIIVTVVASLGLSSNKPAVVNGRTQSSTVGYCPAEAVATVDDTKSDRWDSEYIHCKICWQGALLPDSTGVVRCSYCGKPQKKEIAAN